MKIIIRPLFKIYFILAFTVIALSSCSQGEEPPDAAMFTGKSKVYALHSVLDPAIHGIIKFAERRDNVTLVGIYLKGTSEATSHPAFIHENDLEETGEIMITLNPITGKNGISETMVNKKNDGTSINFDQLSKLKGYVTVRFSQSEIQTFLVQGNIGHE